jgi:hypothetical protein
MLVKPAPGMKVRDPRSRLVVPELGLEVSASDSYWARRLADGDVVEVKPEAPAAAQPAEARKTTPAQKGKE